MHPVLQLQFKINAIDGTLAPWHHRVFDKWTNIGTVLIVHHQLDKFSREESFKKKVQRIKSAWTDFNTAADVPVHQKRS